MAKSKRLYRNRLNRFLRKPDVDTLYLRGELIEVGMTEDQAKEFRKILADAEKEEHDEYIEKWSQKMLEASDVSNMKRVDSIEEERDYPNEEFVITCANNDAQQDAWFEMARRIIRPIFKNEMLIIYVTKEYEDKVIDEDTLKVKKEAIEECTEYLGGLRISCMENIGKVLKDAIKTEYPDKITNIVIPLLGVKRLLSFYILRITDEDYVNEER